MPPALLARLPAMRQVPSLPRLSGNRRSAAAAVSCDEPGIARLQHQRHAVLGRQPDHGRHLARVGRPDDKRRPALDDPPEVVGIGLHVRRCGEHIHGTHDRLAGGGKAAISSHSAAPSAGATSS
jgi:hypothetical protein